MSDPGVRQHLPSGRHTDPAQMAAGIEHSVGHWARDGLGCWTARPREDLPAAGLAAGAMVGTGGCALRVVVHADRPLSGDLLDRITRHP
jgi:hypothetical protein